MSIDDDAERMEALNLEVCLKHRKPEVEHTGICLECEEPTQTVILIDGSVLIGAFCSPSCRDTYEQRQNMKYPAQSPAFRHGVKAGS